MLTAPTASLATRLVRVRAEMRARGLDALVVSHLPNIAYLSNFDGSTAIGLVDGARLYLLSDFRYASAVHALLRSEATPPDVEFVCVEGSYEEGLAATVERSGARVVGLEAATVPWKRLEWWRTRLGAVLSTDGEPPSAGRVLASTDGLVERVRMVKDGHEVGILREAASRLSQVARGVLADDVARAGRSEIAIAAEIDSRMKAAGFSRPAFDTIVASGPHSAQPHARPTDRAVGDGELVVLDFGGVLAGYCSDLTRTVAIGDVGPEARRIYAAVREAQRRAIASARHGQATDAVDAAARDHLASLGLADAFGHGTGHGLGLEIHEEPRLGKRRTEGPAPAVLEAGVVCTIEPGVYVPEVGGVRLEDDILVTTDGCEVITDVPFDARLDD
jgi:Xaa-Pro aminopeptidase